MLTLKLVKPLPFANPCWTANRLTEECKEGDHCSEEFWGSQAERDLGVSRDYYDLRGGKRERYVEVASRWYAIPGSEVFIDPGLAQLFAARDRDKCMLAYLLTFDDINWQNGIIGAALSGNHDFFRALMAVKFPTAQNKGSGFLYRSYSGIFRERAQRAAAIGGNEEIFRYLVPDIRGFDDLQAISYGGNVGLMGEALSGRSLSREDIEDITGAAFLSGDSGMVEYLLRRFPLEEGGLTVFQEQAASSGNDNLLNLTGKEPTLGLYRGYARAGKIDELSPLDEGEEFWSEILEAATDSINPLRFDVALLARERGGVPDAKSLRNAISTGDADLVRLLIGGESPPPDYLRDAVSTGNMELIKMFPWTPDPSLAQFASELGFGEVNIYFTRK